MPDRAVRVITDVAAVDRPFDYALDDAMTANIGDRVRVDFNHRSVRAWIVEATTFTPELKTIKKWLGFGPPASELPLLQWASDRWYSSLSRFLLAASPTRLVTSLPTAPTKVELATATRRSLPSFEPGVLQLAPTTDPIGLILHAYEATRRREGSLLVLVPNDGWAMRLRGRLEQRGCAVASSDQWERMRAGWPVIVGTRGVALAPTPALAGVVHLDADDDAYRSSASPTWDASTLLRERCRLEGAPLWSTSIIPSPSLLLDAPYALDDDLAGGWPRVHVIDRRSSDPRDGVLSREALDAAHSALNGTDDVAVAVVLQRLGSGRLLACVKCGELARCATCQQAEEEVGEELSCPERHEMRRRFCRACGSTNLRRLRSGVSTLARDISAQLHQPVSEITAASESLSFHRVVVGTEAIWTRVRRSGVVIFVDFDQYLLAPRESARRAAITAVGKAGRLVGARRDARGEVVLQTRRNDDDVLQALTSGSFGSIIDEDIATAQLLQLPPYGARAHVTGDGAALFVEQFKGTDVTVDASLEGFTLRSTNVTALTSALRSGERPSEKFRVAVD